MAGKVGVYFSPGNECKDAIIEEIRNAKDTIDICVFTISDNDITREIIRAFKRGINVRIVTDNDTSGNRGSDIEWLDNEGILTRVDISDAHMHHKFAIFDGTATLTGSYNWTRSAHKANRENTIIIRHAGIAGAYHAEFTNLWEGDTQAYADMEESNWNDYNGGH